MTAGTALRSLLALMLAVAVAILGLDHASVASSSALTTALTTYEPAGPVFTQFPQAPPRSRLGHPVAAPHPVVIKPRLCISDAVDVPGHIFYDDINHNLWFVTGQCVRRQFTGNGASVAPSVSPDGSRLAFVDLRRNFSDIWVTDLRYGAKGAIIPTTSVQATLDQSPPPTLQLTPLAPGVYDPRYEWWANKPSWAPGGRLAFVSDRPGFDPNNQENATGAIWEQDIPTSTAAITAAMTGAIKLSDPTAGTGGDDSPSWRPHDPQAYVYVDYYSGLDLPNGQGIIESALAPTTTVAGAAPPAPVALTPHGATMYQPVWSPDGHYIAFVEDVGHRRTNIRLMRYHRPGNGLDYYHAITVATGAPYVSQPFWSPDGRYFGYLSSSGGDFSLVIRPVTYHRGAPRFGPPATVSQAGAVSAEYRPSWGP